GAVTLTGCPPPPRKPTPPAHPWHPARLVPDAELAAPLPPRPRTAPLDPIAGKGVWIWKYQLSERGNTAAIVDRAATAGLRQIWVRVGDSRDGFYGAPILDTLVTAAHQRGIAVVAWGFPHLYDPAADAAWTTSVLDWRGADRTGVDAFSPDIETAAEG